MKKITRIKSFSIDAVDGSETLGQATDVFMWIENIFRKIECDESKKATNKTVVHVYKQIEHVPIEQMFDSLGDDLNKMCLTQHQIKKFCQSNREWLLSSGTLSVYFLLKLKEEGHFLMVGVDKWDAFTAGDEYNRILLHSRAYWKHQPNMPSMFLSDAPWIIVPDSQ